MVDRIVVAGIVVAGIEIFVGAARFAAAAAFCQLRGGRN